MTAEEITTRALAAVLKDATDSGIAVVVVAMNVREKNPVVDVASNVDQPVSVIGLLSEAIGSVTSPDYQTFVLTSNGRIEVSGTSRLKH